MTKIQLRYKLVRPLTYEEADGISRAHAVYGIWYVRLDPKLDGVSVEYDASRLSEKDVESWLIRLGVPVDRAPQPAA